MRPLMEPYRRQLRDMLEEKMPPEGAEAVLAALPASEADMPATREFVRAEIKDLRADTTSQIKDLRVEMTEKFATADTNTNNLRVEMTNKISALSTDMKRWFIATGIALAGVVVAAINTLPN